MITGKLSLRLRPVALVLIIVSVFWQFQIGSAAPIIPQAPQGLRVRPFPPTQYVPDHDYDTKHIALDLRFDWQREQALGRHLLTGVVDVELVGADPEARPLPLPAGCDVRRRSEIASRLVLASRFRPSLSRDSVTPRRSA